MFEICRRRAHLLEEDQERRAGAHAPTTTTPPSRFIVVASAADIEVLTVRASSACAEHRQVVRARIILSAAQGQANAVIAADLGLHVDTVRRWRKRYAAHGLAGVKDLPRSGRPPRFTSVQVAELATEAVTQGMVESISATTVARWLAKDAIKPWQHRCWIFPRDPALATKAGVVPDLYERHYGGIDLGPDEYVISADEKSQLQALRRRHHDLPPGPGRTRRVEFEYRRGGTLTSFAACDVHHAHVIGTIAPKTGIEPITTLLDQVMTTEPYASASRVFWVVDNGSSHHGTRSIERMEQAWPTARLVHLPVHASWLNRVEIYFSILSERPSPPATSPAWTTSPPGSWPSRTATTPPPPRSTGSTPARISTATSPDFADTTAPRTRPPPRRQPDPRRTNGDAH